MVLRATATCLLLSQCSACVPYPHYDYRAPPIRGVIIRDGVPLEGAMLTLGVNFADEVKITTSDRDGKFEIPPIRTFRLTQSLIGDKFYRYEVQINYGGVLYLGFAEASIGNPNELVTLSCDLDKPTKWVAETVYCKV